MYDVYEIVKDKYSERKVRVVGFDTMLEAQSYANNRSGDYIVIENNRYYFYVKVNDEWRQIVNLNSGRPTYRKSKERAVALVNQMSNVYGGRFKYEIAKEETC